MDRFFCFLLRTKSVLRLKNRSRTGKTDDFSSPVGNIININKDGILININMDGNIININRDGNIFNINRDGNIININKNGNIINMK